MDKKLRRNKKAEKLAKEIERREARRQSARNRAEQREALQRFVSDAFGGRHKVDYVIPSYPF